VKGQNCRSVNAF